MTTNEAGRSARLGRRTVEAAAKADARYTIWDSDLKGFGLRVEPSGTKTYIVRYRAGGGRRGTLRQFKIGRSNTLTPDEAREQARAALARVEMGEDPQEQRVKDRETLTVAQLCDRYLADGIATKKDTTNSLDLIRINGFIKRRLGNRKVSEVTTGDVDRMMNDIASGKLKAAALSKEEQEVVSRGGSLPPGRLVRGGATAATKSVKILSAIFAFGVARKLCPANPCDGVKVFADKKRDTFLSPAQLGRLGEALTAAEAEGAQPGLIAIMRLIALTGARKNEIARLRWAEIDFERKLVQLEDSKTGRRPVRLGAAALKLLSEWAEREDRVRSVFVFPHPNAPDGPIRGLDWAWVGVRKRAGLDHVRIHDLRHSFASVGVAGGSGLYLIGKLLGHSNVATTSRYAHLSDDPLAAAADKISGAVEAAMGGSPKGALKAIKGGAK